MAATSTDQQESKEPYFFEESVMPRVSADQRLRSLVFVPAATSAVLMCAAIVFAPLSQAADVEAKPSRNKVKASEPTATVEMFAGMKSGDIEVKFIAMDATRGNVMIENKTKKPLTVKLPKAFAAVPVLAQRGNAGGLGGGGGIGGQGGMGGNQGMGGGMGGMGGMMGGMGGGGMGMGGMGGMGGFMNIPAEKTTKFKVPLVCLEHGKKDPRASVPYEIRPIESFTQNSSVQQLCAMLGEGKLDQRVAQVAAWNLANGLSFEELAAKRLEVLGSPPQPYFSPDEVRAALSVVGEAQSRAVQAEKEAKEKGKESIASPGEDQKQANREQAANGRADGDVNADALAADTGAQKPAARRKARAK
jgi:hypothetical protein